ncbi:hypothetical protein [Parvicella tangerina]|uniref:Uncharacterized protein n=1 Tax=Parvicella tangerina TaxID=2829795 RepID=A0A916NGN3_9FLAO|nr:hypothetical protein [Parvicella tangerina]CAG5080113.1 hypothetical protein CRYO30217_01187 [Parvicella tangerina]
MKSILTVLFISCINLVFCQSINLPHFVVSHARSNFYRFYYVTTSLNNDGAKLFTQADLLSFRYPNMKFAASYLNQSFYSTQGNSESLRLKGNYYMRVTRKSSLILSGSAGLVNSNDQAFIYSGGAALHKEFILISYHLFGSNKALSHTFQFKVEPIYPFKSEDNKYRSTINLSFQGNWAFGERYLAESNNYFQASISKKDLSLSVGLHQSNKGINPNIGVALKDLGSLSFSGTVFFENDQFPTLQIGIIYSKRRYHRRVFHHLPGGVSF